MNGDFRNDIIRLHQTQFLTIEYQNADGSFTPYIHGPVGNSTWAQALGDINNDGYTDMVTGGIQGVQSTLANGTASYTNISMSGPAYFVQGISFGDFNNDGNVDVFVCNDVGISNIWTSDGTGNLVSSGTSIIDFELHPSCLLYTSPSPRDS